MSLAPFAALEQRANAAVMGGLANALVRFDGGDEVAGIFDQAYVLAEIGTTGMAAVAPAVTVPTLSVPDLSGDVRVQITYCGVSSLWLVAEHQPDGTGLSVLLLERAT